MSKPEPAQGQTAFQRWELASLAEALQESSSVTASFSSSSPSTATSPAKTGQAPQSRQDPVEHSAGYAAGLAQGLAEGRRQAEREAERHIAELVQASQQDLQALLSGAEQALVDHQQRFTEELLDLSLTIAQEIVQAAIAIRPELLLPTIEQAIAELPSLQGPLAVRFSAEDLKRIPDPSLQAIRQSGWRLIADRSYPSGRCQVETAEQIVNVSLADRLLRVRESVVDSREA